MIQAHFTLADELSSVGCQNATARCCDGIGSFVFCHPVVSVQLFMGPISRTCVFTLLLALLAHGFAMGGLRDSFESNESTWKLTERDCEVAVNDHKRTLREFHSGQQSEHIRLESNRGTKIYFSQNVEPAYVIEEMVPSVWVKSNRRGIQLLARIQFPRTPAPRGNGYLTTLVTGTIYQQVGAWQQLKIGDITRQLTQQQPVLRNQFGRHVDFRGAFLDMLVLNTYTGPANTEIWIDDLEIDPHVAAGQRASKSNAASMGNNLHSKSQGTRVDVRGTTVQINGRPTFMRIIQHNGESFGWLKKLGFNCILLSKPPTAEALVEAKQHDIWLVALHPPNDQTLSHDNLIACVADGKIESKVQNSRRLSVADLTKEKRPRQNSDIALVNQRTQQLRTPTWTVVATQADPNRVRLATYHAIASGTRGILFQSGKRLDSNQAATQLRATALQLINEEITLLEPWAAGGFVAERITTNDPHVAVSVLATPRSRLLIALRSDSVFNRAPIQFLDPGAARSARPIQLAAWLEPRWAKHRRQSGGLWIALDQVSPIATVVVTDDQLVTNHLTKRSAQQRHRTQALKEELASRYRGHLAIP